MSIQFSIFPLKTLYFLLHFLLLLPLFTSLDYTNLIYKGCASQKFQDPSGSYSQTLKTLFNTLIVQSTKANFSKNTLGETGKSAILGLYQCRGDLDGVDCNNCVSQFPRLARKHCGEVIAVRIQLVGCYMKYEIEGFRQVPSDEMLYKQCRGDHVSDADFAGNRESAFEEVVNGVGSDGSEFYAASYGSIYVMGQCEGDLSGSDCSECVRNALERVKVECGSSKLGQVYLNQCYVSYSYYPHGVGRDNNDDDNNNIDKTSTQGTKHNTAKTTAIVVGATAAAGFGVAILLVIKSAFKKKSTKHYGGYGDY